MRTRRLSPNLVLITFGALLAIGGAVAMRLELTPYTTNRDTDSSRLLELANAGTGYGLSDSSRQAPLTDCRENMLSLMARLQTSHVRNSLYQNCLAVSDKLGAEQPTLSIAWLTGAIAAAQMNDSDGFNLRMARSMRAGRVEQWIAEMRIPIVENYFVWLTDEVRAGNAADMLLLTENDGGLLTLARIYVKSPSSRERITAVIEPTSEVIREKFARRVRLLSEAGI